LCFLTTNTANIAIAIVRVGINTTGIISSTPNFSSGTGGAYDTTLVTT